MNKHVELDQKAQKEFLKLPEKVQAEFADLFSVLEENGKLEEPFAKKLTRDIFEMRVRVRGQWRGLYSYVQNQFVIVLIFFNKKSQKTPLKEIRKAENRLQNYID